MLSARLERIAAALAAVNLWLGRALRWLVPVMVGVVLLVVVLRYGFATGSIALQESALYLHALVFMLGAGYTFARDGHVRVDIFYQGWSPRQRAWVDLVGDLALLLPVGVYLVACSWDYVALAWRIREASPETGGLPLVFVLKTAMPLCGLLLVLQALADALRQAAVLLGDQR